MMICDQFIPHLLLQQLQLITQEAKTEATVRIIHSAGLLKAFLHGCQWTARDRPVSSYSYLLFEACTDWCR